MNQNSKIKERQIAIEMRLSGATFKEIQEKTGHNKNFVKKWLEKWRKTGSLVDSYRKGSPTKFSSSLKKKVISELKKRHRSCRNVSQKLKRKSILVSKSSVHRIAKSVGLRNVSYKKKPFLSLNHQSKRLKFAKNHQTKNLKFWKRVIWSDESSFEEGEQARKVWIEKNEPLPIKQTKKYPKKIQVWGAIGWKGKTQLYFIPQGKRINSEAYQNILQQSLLPCANFISCKPFLFMQDNAHCRS